jgi:glycosyltransferase involved in cell wall biosynthesis
MKLLVVSHTPHFVSNGQIVGWEPTTEEMNHLSSMFEEIRHIAWLHPEAPPSAVVPYSTNRISLIAVNPSGGKGFLNKLSILRAAPTYLSTIWKHLAWADMIHVRCPSNISLMALLMLLFTKRPKLRWIKYATNWSPLQKEAWSFSFQRWLLTHNFHRGIVTVNGSWPQQPEHVYSFMNPCIGEEFSCDENLEKRLESPICFLYVGRIVEQKGLGRALNILAELRKKGISFRFDIVGDGDRQKFEMKAKELGLEDVVHFHGWLNRSNLTSFYLRAHFILFPSSASEGWPKVLSEAMAYGVVPIAGKISSIPQILQEFKTGTSIPPYDKVGFVHAILDYIQNPDRWYQESQNAIGTRPNFTYSQYLKKLSSMFLNNWASEKELLDPIEVSKCNTP